MIGAVISETLRVASLLPIYPEAATQKFSRAVKISGRIHVIPAGTMILVNTSATRDYGESRSPDHHT